MATRQNIPVREDNGLGQGQGGLPAGFIAGAFPKELEQFFGSASGFSGYKIETLTDKNRKTYNQLSVATGPNSSQTFGAGFLQGPDGTYSTYSPQAPSDGGGGGGGGGGSDAGGGATPKTPAQIAAEANAAAGRGERQSAYDLLYSEFKTYGLESLVAPLKDLIISGASPSEFTIKLRETDAYKKRFAANAQRVASGLRALSEFEYVKAEDAYQGVMRRRGLPESYYAKGDLGVQKGFESLLAGDVSSDELEDRIVTAQDRVLNANPEVAKALKAFYPGISNGDILAYSLDPANAINAIKRKITTAEIGGAAARFGLTTNVEDATYLEKYGITKNQAEQGYGTIAGGLQRGSQLASIYGQDPYNQATAETELFKLPGIEEARKQRQKITGLEQATFSGKAGVSSSALARDRAGGY